MNYQDLNRIPGEKDNCPAPSIQLIRHGINSIGVTLHGYEVLTFYPNGKIKFDSCGRTTVATKQRLNAYQGHVKIYQDTSSWYVQVLETGKIYAFEDGMIFDPKTKEFENMEKEE